MEIKTKYMILFCLVFTLSTLADGLDCYHCFYCENSSIAKEFESIFGGNMGACERNPPECSLQSEAAHHISADEVDEEIGYLKTGQFSFAILNADPKKGTTGKQADYDHCVTVTGSIDGSKFVFRTGRYLGDRMHGQCIDTEMTIKGRKIIERDCYCSDRNKCNGVGSINNDDRACKDIESTTSGVESILFPIRMLILTFVALLHFI